MKRVISLMVALLLAVSFSAVSFAAVSPKGETKYEVTVESNKGGSIKDLYEKTENDDGTVTLEHISNDKFLRWEINGKYDLVDGNLKSDYIVIRPHEDLVAKMVFALSDKEGKDDDGSKSPETGNSALPLMAVVTVGAGIAAVISKKCLNK